MLSMAPQLCGILGILSKKSPARTAPAGLFHAPTPRRSPLGGRLLHCRPKWTNGFSSARLGETRREQLMLLSKCTPGKSYQVSGTKKPQSGPPLSEMEE